MQIEHIDMTPDRAPALIYTGVQPDFVLSIRNTLVCVSREPTYRGDRQELSPQVLGVNTIHNVVIYQVKTRTDAAPLTVKGIEGQSQLRSTFCFCSHLHRTL